MQQRQILHDHDPSIGEVFHFVCLCDVRLQTLLHQFYVCRSKHSRHRIWYPNQYKIEMTQYNIMKIPIYSSLDTRWSTRICVYYPPEMTNRLILKTKKYVNTRCLHSLKKCLLLQCNMINNASWDKNCCMPHKYQTEQNIIFTYCIFMTNLVCSIFCLL